MFLKEYDIILGSASPRRSMLLKELGVSFKIKLPKKNDESFPDELFREDIAVYLAEKKAEQMDAPTGNELIITADTIVWHNQEVLGKPINYSDAFQMLMRLNGNTHQVITGVALTSAKKQVSFYNVTNVEFAKLSQEEIRYYIEKYRPYDKAGSYGIQEWIGYIGINHIEGSYFNVVGLPVQQLYNVLKTF